VPKQYRSEGYKTLIVWKRSYNFTIDIYRVTKKFPREELFGLTSQLRRAASSIPVNIAEGYTRSSPREYTQYLLIAKGSCAEVETLLLMVRDLDYISQEEFAYLDNSRQEIAKLLQGLINSLKH